MKSLRLALQAGDRGEPRATFYSQFRGHLPSRLTFLRENRHRAGLTGSLRTATLADVGRCRMGFPLRDGLRASD